MIKLYSTLTRKKENFVPLEAKTVRMYACGITPYDEIHIGHARQAVVYDVIRAYFEYAGYRVTYVRNFTDVDDKIIKRANQEGKDSRQVSEFFISESVKELETLKVKKANYEPKVTECINDIIEFIKVLVAKGFAYVNNGEVIYDISKFPAYGKLSLRKKEELINIENSPNKRNNSDFVLWKPYKSGEPYWESPWSKGRPGWHIECSVMAKKYLGDEIDIHGGGIDLIFPHHENEIAQSESYSGKQFASYWVHNGLVMVEGTKMSKSLGNFLTVKDALKSYFPEELRYVILTQTYGSNVNFSNDLFLNARKRLYYFYNTLARINVLMKGGHGSAPGTEQLPEILAGLEEKFTEYMNDNFNTPKVIAEMTEVFKELNKIIDSKKYSTEEKRAIFKVFLPVFGKISSVLRLFDENPVEYVKKLKEKALAERGLTEEYIIEILSSYKFARKTKNYEEADKIKGELRNKNISIQDNLDSVGWEVIF